MTTQREKELIKLIETTPDSNPKWIEYLCELSKLNPHAVTIKTKRGWW